MRENRTETQDRETVRQMLASRYHGAIEITDEMVDAVMAGLKESTS